MILACKEIRENEINKIKENEVLEDCKVAFIQVGDNQASNVYVRNKIKLCEEVGIKVLHITLEDCISEDRLLERIGELNVDSTIHGIMVQLPLPQHINENSVINAITPTKDLDGFTHINKGKLMSGDKDAIVPCTPAGIIDILDSINFKYKGAKVVIVGRSNIVGKPMAQLLINKGCTVTVCNSSTEKLYMGNLIASADLFISAIGQANYFNEDFFKEIGVGTLYFRDIVAIDVGINRDKDNKLCGDISRDLYDSFKYITPVPNGVGVMTVLNVIKNSIRCYKINSKRGL